MMYALVSILKPGCIVSFNISATRLMSGARMAQTQFNSPFWRKKPGSTEQDLNSQSSDHESSLLPLSHEAWLNYFKIQMFKWTNWTNVQCSKQCSYSIAISEYNYEPLKTKFQSCQNLWPPKFLSWNRIWIGELI